MGLARASSSVGGDDVALLHRHDHPDKTDRESRSDLEIITPRLDLPW